MIILYSYESSLKDKIGIDRSPTYGEYLVTCHTHPNLIFECGGSMCASPAEAVKGGTMSVLYDVN